MTTFTKTLAEAAAWLAGATRLHIEDQEARAAAWDAERAAGVPMGSTANGRRRERAFRVSLGNLEAAEAAVDDPTTALEAPHAHAAAAMTAAERGALHAARTAEDGARGAYLAAVTTHGALAVEAGARDAYLTATTRADQDAAHRAYVAAWDATETGHHADRRGRRPQGLGHGLGRYRHRAGRLRHGLGHRNDRPQPARGR